MDNTQKEADIERLKQLERRLYESVESEEDRPRLVLRKSRSPSETESERGDNRIQPRSPSPGRRHERSRSPDRDLQRRDRSRSPIRGRRKRSPSPDQWQRQKRGRGRSPPRRDRSPPYRRRSSPPPRRRGRSPTRRSRLDDEQERLARTVFVTQLPVPVDRRELEVFFGRVGRVIDVSLIPDRSGRPLGFGYVEFSEPGAVNAAVELSGQKLRECSLKVQSAAVQLAQAPPSSSTLNSPSAGTAKVVGGARVHIANIPFDVNESELVAAMEKIGPVANVVLPRIRGQARGYAFVHFTKIEDAEQAVAQSERIFFGGRPLRIRLNTEASSTQGPGDSRPEGLSALDDTDDRDGLGRGVKMTSQSRMELMNKLIDGASSSVTSPSLRASTPILRMQKMFSAEESLDENVLRDIENDVREECEAKFGRVVMVRALKGSDGIVTLQMESLEAAKNAKSVLHGRFFGGQRIDVDFLLPINE